MDINSLIISETDGMAIAQSNPTIKDIAIFMENPVVKEFYKKYLVNSDKDSILFMLWIYHLIDNIGELSPYEKMALLSKCIKNTESRRYLVDLFTKKTNKFLL